MERSLGSRYVLAERLGGGGMGTVYRATRRDGGPDRAVKLLRAELAEDPVILARFVQEHSLMVKLRSPHLVAVEDLIVDGDLVAIVMELVTGGTLRRYAETQGPLAAPTALGFVRQILLGLDVVHAHGVVHRDVKPENVMLDLSAETVEPIAKVSDFGIARLVDGPRMTGTFHYLGTAHYCAPEIAEGASPTPAVDVYATGVVLYQLLTGATPFAGLTPLALFRAQAEQPPPRSPLIGDAVWSVLSRWLTVDPAARPPDARQALLELDDLLKMARPPVSGRALPPPASPGVSLPGSDLNATDQAAQALKAQAGQEDSRADLPQATVGLAPPAMAPDYLEVIHDPPQPEPIAWAPFSWDAGKPSQPGLSATFPPLNTDGGSRPADVDPALRELTAHPAKPPHRSKTILVAAGVIVVLGAAAGAPVLLSGNSSSDSSSVSSSSSTSTMRFTLIFPTEVFPDSGVSLVRTWTLAGGAHPSLHADLVFRTSKANPAPVDEVLPKSLVSDVSKVSFLPRPKIVQADPVVRYTLPAVAGQTITDRYDVPVSSGDVSMTTMRKWAAEQGAQAGELYRTMHQLATLSLEPGSVAVSVGSTVRLQLVGKQTDGAPAPTVAFGGVAYAVANRTIATVASDGTLTGVAPGSTTVKARLGALTSSEIVTVAAAPDPTAGPTHPLSSSGPSASAHFTTEPAPGPKTKPAPGATTEPQPSPTIEPVPGPTTGPASDPTIVPAPDPTIVPVPDPTTVPVPDPTTAPAPDPTTVPAPDPTTVPAP